MSQSSQQENTTSLKLTRDNILAQFDHLLKHSTLKWTPPTTRLTLDDQGFPFEFLVTPAQVDKPDFPTETPDEAANGSTTPSPPTTETPKADESSSPSDIDNHEPGYHLASLSTHRLIFNKFSIYRPQYILLTADPSHRQTSPLDAADFRAAVAALGALPETADNGGHYVIFNCGRAAGGSRLHKHLQVFERTGELLPEKLLAGSSVDVPYTYCLTPISDSNSAEALYAAYTSHLAQLSATLALDISDMPHNVIFTERYIMTIPRREAGVGRATANAAGMMGMVWVPSEEVLELWKELGPWGVLARLGFEGRR